LHQSGLRRQRRQVLAFIDYFNRTMAKPFKWDLPGQATMCMSEFITGQISAGVY